MPLCIAVIDETQFNDDDDADADNNVLHIHIANALLKMPWRINEWNEDELFIA